MNDDCKFFLDISMTMARKIATMHQIEWTEETSFLLCQGIWEPSTGAQHFPNLPNRWEEVHAMLRALVLAKFPNTEVFTTIHH